MKAYAQWVGRRVQNDYAGGEQLNRNAQQIGVRSFITPTIETWASIGNGKYRTTVGTTSANITGWQLGTNYLLSKRTNLYAIYGQTQTSSGSTTPNTTGAGANQYAVGVRHTF